MWFERKNNSVDSKVVCDLAGWRDMLLHAVLIYVFRTSWRVKKSCLRNKDDSVDGKLVV